MTRGSTLFAVLSWLVATAPAVAQPLAPSTRVDLRFGWKPGMEMAVTAIRTRTRAADERTTRSSTSRYTVRVEANGEQLRIRFTDPEFVVEDVADSVQSSEMVGILAKLADLMPDFLVTREGEFVGIHDLPGFQKKFQAFLAEVMPPNLDPQAVAQMQSLLTSEEFLNSRASEEWNAIVGAWVGSSFEIGIPAEYVRVEPVAVFSGSEMRMNYAFAAESVFACQRAGVARACAQLAMRSMADPEDTKRMIASFRATLQPEQAPNVPVFETLVIDTKLRVTTEPNGLIPHAYSLTKIIRGTIASLDGELPVEQIDTTEVRYVHP